MEDRKNDIEWSLIRKSLEASLDATEQQELKEWLAAAPPHQTFYDELSAFNPATGWDRLSGEALNRETTVFLQKMKHYKRRRIIYRLSGVAAVLFIAVSAILFFLSSPGSGESDSLIFVQRPPQHPQLITEGGTRLDLINEMDRIRKEYTGILSPEERGLDYSQSTEGTKEQIHTLLVPRGGEYLLTLADGSRVWVNSETELSYPVNFTGDNRVVSLKGEAYFEVAKDDKPFIVKTQGVEISVYGTQFNVNSYRKEHIRTVLVSGRVSVSSPAITEKFLRPEEMAEINLTTGNYSIQKVDIGSHIAWKDGFFSFDGENIEQIMEKLSRWYDFEVIYTDENVKSKRFSGHISRDHQLTGILETIQRTALVRFSIDGYTISISNGEK